MSDIPKPTKKRFYVRVWFWFLIVLAVAIVFAVSYGAAAFQDAQIAAYSYLEETVQVERRTVEKTISTSGRIVSDEVASLTSAVPGTVTEVLVEVKEEVEEDETLLEVGAVEIKAPFDGRITSLGTFVGAPVTPGVPLLEIGFQSSHIEFYASEAEVLDLEEGLDVTMTVPAYNNGRDEYSGEVIYVDAKKQTTNAAAAAMGQSAESGYLVNVSLGDIPEELNSLIGLTIDLEIDVEQKQNVISLITGAVQYDDNNAAYVYISPTVDQAFVERAAEVEDVEELLERKYIEVDFQGDNYIEITSGLREGDDVLLFVPSTGSGSLF
ncbi:efflux RND transporter periplasmic adaptor subunit [Patescibacteria group bacterium]